MHWLADAMLSALIHKFLIDDINMSALIPPPPHEITNFLIDFAGNCAAAKILNLWKETLG